MLHFPSINLKIQTVFMEKLGGQLSVNLYSVNKYGVIRKDRESEKVPDRGVTILVKKTLWWWKHQCVLSTMRHRRLFGVRLEIRVERTLSWEQFIDPPHLLKESPVNPISRIQWSNV